MKKLMITLGLVAMAAVSAQASKVKWSVSGVSPYGSDTDTEGYYMACFCADATVAASLEGVYTSVADATTWAKAKGVGDVNVLKTAALSDSGEKTTMTAYTQAAWVSPSAVASEYGNFYAIIFNAEAIADATAYMVTEVKQLEFSTNASANQTVAIGAGEWQSIPEPTSGLLLLIGVAGLALRRRRA